MAEDKKQVMHGIVQKIAANKKYRLILVVIGLGLMAVLFLSGFFTQKYFTNRAGTNSCRSDKSAGDYAKELEGNLTEVLAKISGVGTVQVMVTIEKGVENIYATEQKTSKQVTENRSTDTDTKKSGKRSGGNKLYSCKRCRWQSKSSCSHTASTDCKRCCCGL